LSKKYRVIVPDLPGFGKSEKPELITHKFLVKWFDKFTQALSIDYPNASVYGMSLGGTCIAESIHFNEFKQIIFESVPFDSKMLITKELLFFKILSSFIPISFLRTHYEKNKNFRGFMVRVYKFIRPRTKIYFPDKVLEEFEDNVNLETVYEIAGDLSKLNIIFPNNTDLEKVTLVYDKEDPTVSFEKVEKYFSGKKCRLIVTDFGVHAPSTYPSKVEFVLNKIFPGIEAPTN